jgi:hypothetical protein
VIAALENREVLVAWLATALPSSDLLKAAAIAAEQERAARAAAAPFAVGDEVDALLRGRWRRAIVRVVECDLIGEFRYRVSPARMDGTWSGHVQHAYGIRPVE